MADAIQKRLQTELDKFKAFQKDLQKYGSARQQLESQLNENNLVLDELKLLEADAGVFKMIGPVLVRQELEESKQNVQKRIDYINGEIKRHEGVIKDLEGKTDSQRETIGKLQAQFQQMQQPTSNKAVKA